MDKKKELTTVIVTGWTRMVPKDEIKPKVESIKKNIKPKEITVLLYTVPQAARMLSLSIQTVWKKVYQREIGSVTIGRTRRIAATELQRLIDDNTIPARPE